MRTLQGPQGAFREFFTGLGKMILGPAAVAADHSEYIIATYLLAILRCIPNI
jgi:hypothetical protein